MNCPCGSGQNFEQCCQPLIEGKRDACSPEELMRSRYSAYTIRNIDYLRATHDPQNLQDMSVEGAREWAEKATFTGLQILRSEEAGNKGTVEFIASYDWEGQPETHHEVSTFRKQKGRWYFKNGRVKETPRPQ